MVETSTNGCAPSKLQKDDVAHAAEFTATCGRNSTSGEFNEDPKPLQQDVSHQVDHLHGSILII